MLQNTRPRRGPKAKEKETKNENGEWKKQYFVWRVAKHEFLIIFTKKEKGTKKQYFVWPVAKYDVPPANAAQARMMKKAIFRLTCCKTWCLMKNSFFLKNGIVKISSVLIAKNYNNNPPAFSPPSFSGEKVMVLTFRCENDEYSLGNRQLYKNDASQVQQQ